ncbi:HAUS augmin-like complex subunit 8 [Spea bombifrons]|uniref:HAUS augmin-like complex subunit 8 n=1 Tax=Spea bombifrons TaxID=233779 RepID=UPI00234AC350|nr:HAUS augmin-like complex subunit 8 [Spea bombifrons]
MMAEAGAVVLGDGSQNSSGGSSGDVAIKKNKGPHVVKSRYMQYDKGKIAKKNLSNTTVCSGGKASDKSGSGTPTRRSIAPQRMKGLPGVPSSAMDGNLFWKEDLQSTLLDGHRAGRPELDLSVINDKTMQRSTPKSVSASEQKKAKKDTSSVNAFPDDMVEMLESQTLLLTYLAMKMQKNLGRLEEKAERSLLIVSDEKDHLQEMVHKLRREKMLFQREEELKDLLEKQTEALAPSVEAKETFKDNYRTFALALDCTRHQLPIKDIHIAGTRQRYLEELQKHLEISKSLLDETVSSSSGENAELFGTIKDLEDTVRKTDAELSRTFHQVLDLSFKVNKEISLQNQKAVEESCELDVVKQWYFDQAIP